MIQIKDIFEEDYSADFINFISQLVNLSEVSVLDYTTSYKGRKYFHADLNLPNNHSITIFEDLIYFFKSNSSYAVKIEDFLFQVSHADKIFKILIFNLNLFTQTKIYSSDICYKIPIVNNK